MIRSHGVMSHLHKMYSVDAELQKKLFGWSLASGCCWSCGYSSNPGLHLPGQHAVGGKQASGPH